jgi:hypothetical protein
MPEIDMIVAPILSPLLYEFLPPYSRNSMRGIRPIFFDVVLPYRRSAFLYDRFLIESQGCGAMFDPVFMPGELALALGT